MSRDGLPVDRGGPPIAGTAELRTVAGAPTVWFTGLSGAGKTTIARAVAGLLADAGVAHTLLDGDELRATLSADLGFSREDRAEQVRRVGHLARILGDAGVIPLAALVSPFRADRDAVRALHAPGRFVEVHVATELAVCAERDVKGLYARSVARSVAGEEDLLTGVGQDYEAPDAPELKVYGDENHALGSTAATLTNFLSPWLAGGVWPQLVSRIER